MQKDNDQRADKELEIDEFLSQFEPDVDEPAADFDSFLVSEDSDDSNSFDSAVTTIDDESQETFEDVMASLEDTTPEADTSAKSGFFGFLKNRKNEKTSSPDNTAADKTTISTEDSVEESPVATDSNIEIESEDTELNVAIDENFLSDQEPDPFLTDLNDVFEPIEDDSTEDLQLEDVASESDSEPENADVAAGAAFIGAALRAERETEAATQDDRRDENPGENEPESPASDATAAEADLPVEDIEDIEVVKTAEETTEADIAAADAKKPAANRFSFLKNDNTKKAFTGAAAAAAGAVSLKSAKKINKKGIRSFLSFFVDNPDYDPSKGETIMKDGKMKKNKPKKFSFMHLIRDGIILGAILVLAFTIYSFVIISMSPKIDPTNIYDTIEQSSTIYDSKGKAVDTVYYSQDRKIIKYDDLPDNTVNAFVALEDKTFWKHHGFNWTRMIGAVVSSITGHGRISGTSTITQQLARNVYLADTKDERSIKRKILEMYYAREIERTLSKEDIITAYLNTIYLGFGTYGVESASEAYFSKPVSKLNLIESAALAALPQAPDSYALVQYIGEGDTVDDNDTVIKKSPDKYVCNDESKDRRDTCLDMMLAQEYITQKQYDKVYGKDLKDFIKADLSNSSSAYSYFNEYLIDQVISDLQKKYDISESEATDMVYSGGLQIYSTVDSTAQKVIVKEFKNNANFPGLTGYRTDGSGNIVDQYGNIMLYDADTYFTPKGNFKLTSKECKINDDGSLTIKTGKRLNIYTTQVGDGVDYSLEFKSTYFYEGSTLYMYNGGYVNIPAEYKTVDNDDNLVISAQYFTDYPGTIKLKKKEKAAVITDDAFTLPEKTIEPQAAMVIVEVGTGEVKAMVGGRKQTGRQLYNRALNPRQSGSSIKPISVYSGALQKSFDLAAKGETFPIKDTGHDNQGARYYGNYLTESSVIVDERMTFNGQSWPQNAGGGYMGGVTMKTALQNSINVCAVKLYLQVGADYTADLVEKFGITTLDREGGTNDLNAAALALGGLTNGVIPLEMAQAYAAFPNKGVRQSSIAYTKVTDRNGKVLLKGESESTKVLDKGVAYIMTDMLKSVVSQGIGYAASISGVQSGGKTGTTSNEYDIWFDGFTPSYAAALWIGTDVNIQLTSMSGTAARLWGVIMDQIPEAKKGSYPGQPDNVVNIGGYYYTKGTEGGRSTYFAEMAAKRAAEAKKKAEEAAAKKKAAASKKKKND